MEAVHEQNDSNTPITSPPQIPLTRLISEGHYLEPRLNTLRSNSVPLGFERRRAASYIKQVPRDDDIVCVEDVDICLDIPTRLRQLDYPKAEDGHDEDVAKVIRKKFSKLGLEESTQDVLAILSNDQLQSGFMSWQARFEEAATEEEDDTFWKNVCFIVLLLSCIILLLLLHFVVVV